MPKSARPAARHLISPDSPRPSSRRAAWLRDCAANSHPVERPAQRGRGLYPALQKLLANGWVKADWTTSDTGREVRSYKLTAKGLKQLDAEKDDYQRTADAIAAILESA